MGKKSKPKPPPAPDIQGMIEHQSRENRVDTSTPFGSQSWSRGPDGRWSTQTSFSPEMQPIFERMLGRAQRGPNEYSYNASPLTQALGGEFLGRAGMDSSLAQGIGQGKLNRSRPPAIQPSKEPTGGSPIASVPPDAGSPPPQLSGGGQGFTGSLPYLEAMRRYQMHRGF